MTSNIFQVKLFEAEILMFILIIPQNLSFKNFKCINYNINN